MKLSKLSKVLLAIMVVAALIYVVAMLIRGENTQTLITVISILCLIAALFVYGSRRPRE